MRDRTPEQEANIALLIDVAATFGTSWLDTLRSVLLPATLPYVFAGLRVSLGLAFVSVVAAEMVAVDSQVRAMWAF